MSDESQHLIAARPTRRPMRPFYLKVLVAAVALMVVGSPGFARLAGLFGPGTWTLWWLDVFYLGVSSALILGTLVLAPIAVNRLRRQGREVSRSYGVSAVLAAATGLGFALLQSLWSLFMLFYSGFIFSRNWHFYLGDAERPAIEFSAVAITAAWGTLALMGAGRRASNGFELLGLAFGLLWILAYVGRCGLDIALRLML